MGRKQNSHITQQLLYYLWKINDKMKNSIVIDYMQKVDTPVGKRYIQISEDVLYDIYHGRLPVFSVEDICNDKYVNLG